MALARRSEYRVSADIGGTFTDIVVAGPDGQCLTKKVLSSPDDYSRSIVDGLASLLSDHGIAGVSVQEIIHGTTVATNAILESKGAKTALITTAGFRDVLELRRLRVPQLYNLAYKPPAPIAERHLRFEVTERMTAAGCVLTPLAEEDVIHAAKRMKEEGVQSVAVCLLHSYRNPAHELRVGEIVRELLPDVHLSLSVEVLPEIREYERTSTTVINAYLGPTVRKYLDSLELHLHHAGIDAPLRIMQSNGGVMPARAAGDKPAHIVESGPAAGVIGAQVIARRSGLGNVITFDMGGTTAKASIIEDGQVTRTTEYEVGAGISLSSKLVKGGGYALNLPVLDIAEVGAGGGSLVWIDRAGALKVGPQSAGAVPGPACYGRGGVDPTVTDANVVLGYVNPSELAGGTLKLQPDRAFDAIEGVANSLGLDVYEAARGIHQVVNANMIRAIKAVSTYRGRDPRDFALFAFGGSGPVHACGIAHDLGIRKVLVPAAPGLFSAVGLLEAQIENHLVQTFFTRLADADVTALREVCREMEARADQLFSEQPSDPKERRSSWMADLRYVGQAYELSVPMEAIPTTHADVLALGELFEEEHQKTYGHRARTEPIEFVNIRLVARLERPDREPIRANTVGGAVVADRRAYFGGGDRGGLLTPVVSRSQLTGRVLAGPMIIEDYDATTVVPPGSHVALDNTGTLIIDVTQEG